MINGNLKIKVRNEMVHIFHELMGTKYYKRIECFIYGISKARYTICMVAIEMQAERTDLRTQWGKERVG